MWKGVDGEGRVEERRGGRAGKGEWERRRRMTRRAGTRGRTRKKHDDRGGVRGGEQEDGKDPTVMRISLHKDPMYMLYIKDPKLEYMQDPTVIVFLSAKRKKNLLTRVPSLYVSLHKNPMYML